MDHRVATATTMAFREQIRRPLIPILLVVVPAFVVLWSVSITKPEARQIELADGLWITTTMRALHGPEMAKFSVAFVAALVGAFVMQASRRADRRLVVAGLGAGRVIAARLLVLLGAVLVVVAAAAGVTALRFTPSSWPAVVLALLLTGLIYGLIGVLAGALLDRLATTYVILFVVMIDLSVVQTPMFHASPSRYAPFLPGFGPTQVMLEGAFSPSFHAYAEASLAVVWITVLGLAVTLVLSRSVRSAT